MHLLVDYGGSQRALCAFHASIRLSLSSLYRFQRLILAPKTVKSPTLLKMTVWHVILCQNAALTCIQRPLTLLHLVISVRNIIVPPGDIPGRKDVSARTNKCSRKLLLTRPIHRVARRRGLLSETNTSLNFVRDR